MPKCLGETKDGRPCQAPPQTGSAWCVFHDEAQAEKLRVAKVKGGIHSRRGPSVASILRWAKETKGGPDALGDLILGLSVGVIKGRVKPAVLNSVTRAVRALEWLSHMEEA